MMKFDLHEFIKSRNEALFSFDREKIVAHFSAYGTDVPENEDVFWGAVSKAVLSISNAPEDARQKAMDVLDRLGWSYSIFGPA